MDNAVPPLPESSIDANDPTPAIGQPETGLPLKGPGPPVSGNKTALQHVETIKPGTLVFVESADGSRPEKYFVRQSSRNGAVHSIRLVRSPSTEKAAGAQPQAKEPDYYDVLQIGAKAEAETIYRVYRIMATRFHPDNPKTGDIEKFLLLNTAYEVLSDPVRRAEYDARREEQNAEPMPIFELKDFVTGVEAEANRRLGVLSLLYNQRRQDPERPAVSLLYLEHRMAFPREYLNFTMWFLRAKNYVTAADNADYTISALGAEFVEANIGKSEVLAQMLFPGRT
jgi:curved DNA-binding protein